MKILIIGSDVAGTKFASKIKRENIHLDVTIITENKNITFDSSGLPYLLRGVVKDKTQLLVNTPESFCEIYGVNVFNEFKVKNLDLTNKKVITLNSETNIENTFNYDKLIIACDSTLKMPEIEGVELKNVFSADSVEDINTIKENVSTGEIKRAVVVGSDFAALEIAENLHSIGVRTVVLEQNSNVLSNCFDTEFSEHIETKMAAAGVMAMTDTSITGIIGTEKVEKITTTKRAIKTDAVIFTNTLCAKLDFINDTEIITENGIIVTDNNFETNLKDVYAIGACAYVQNLIKSKPSNSSIDATPNIVGRVLAENIAHNTNTFSGVLDTKIAKLPGDINVACTGITENSANDEKRNVVSMVVAIDDKAPYFTNISTVLIKLIADVDTRRLIGAQVIGKHGVDKVIDIAVTAISLGATVDSLKHLNFAYSPPFSTYTHPFSNAINSLINKMDEKLKTITATEFKSLDLSEYIILDISKRPTIAGAEFIEFSEITKDLAKYDKEQKIIIICPRGRRAFVAHRALVQLGFKNTFVLEAGAYNVDIKLI